MIGSQVGYEFLLSLNLSLIELYVDRCECNRCMPMERGVDSVCCLEQDPVYAKCQQGNYACITMHPSFQKFCLDKEVLDMSYLSYQEDTGEDTPYLDKNE